MNTCSVLSANFKEAVSLCGMAVKKRSPNPIAQCIHLRPFKDGIQMSATNFVVTVGMELASEGSLSASVDAAMLASAAASIDGDTTSLRLDGTRLIIEGKNSKFTLASSSMALPPIHFPEGPSVAIDGEALADAINRVSFAAIQDDTTTSWKNGVYFKPGKDSITLSACDERRIATARISGVVGSGKPYLSSAVHAVMIGSIVAGDSASLVVTEDAISARGGDKWIVCPAMESRYPDLSIPFAAPAKATAKVNRAALLDAVKSVSLVLDGELASAVSVAFAMGRFTVSATSSRGEATAGGDAECSEPFDFVAHYRRLADALRFAVGDQANIVLSEQGAHSVAANVRINPESDFKQLLVPMDLSKAAAAA